jgi:hypothetical protein
VEVKKAEDVSVMVPDSDRMRLAIGQQTYGYEGMGLPPRAAYPLPSANVDEVDSSQAGKKNPVANDYALAELQAKHKGEEA